MKTLDIIRCLEKIDNKEVCNLTITRDNSLFVEFMDYTTCEVNINTRFGDDINE